ncbi:hypothetical protein KAI78_03845 [bacterium]|nr:hypothetical protein [bacterium]
MNIPKIREIIALAPVRYVDVDNIIIHAQTDRRAKIDACVSVIFPHEQSLLFFRKGELFSSGTIKDDEFQPASMLSILRKMKEFKKKDEDASMSFFEIDENILNGILNKFYAKPKYNLNTRFTDVNKLFSVMIKNKYNGFIEFIYKNSSNLIFVENGELSYLYLCDDLQPFLEETIKRNDITLLLDSLVHLFKEEEEGVQINIFDNPVEIEPQLSPHIVDLMEKILQKTLEELGKEHSPDNLVKYFNSGVDKLAQKIPEIKNVLIETDNIDLSGVDLDVESFVTAVALLLNEFIDKLNLVFGPMVVKKIFGIIKDFRYALEGVNFFDKSYMKSMLK